MQIRVDADDHIDSSGELAPRVEGLIEVALERFRQHIARVDVHLSQLSRREAADRDMLCRMAVYAAGASPIEVAYAGLTLTEAIHETAAQLEAAVFAALGRLKPAAAAVGHPEPELGH